MANPYEAYSKQLKGHPRPFKQTKSAGITIDDVITGLGELMKNQTFKEEVFPRLLSISPFFAYPGNVLNLIIQTVKELPPENHNAFYGDLINQYFMIEGQE